MNSSQSIHEAAAEANQLFRSEVLQHGAPHNGRVLLTNSLVASSTKQRLYDVVRNVSLYEASTLHTNSEDHSEYRAFRCCESIYFFKIDVYSDEHADSLATDPCNPYCYRILTIGLAADY